MHPDHDFRTPRVGKALEILVATAMEQVSRLEEQEKQQVKAKMGMLADRTKAQYNVLLSHVGVINELRRSLVAPSGTTPQQGTLPYTPETAPRG